VAKQSEPLLNGINIKDFLTILVTIVVC